MKLAIIDDWFPNLTTGFRVAEFVHHLKTFPNLTVFSSSPAFQAHYPAFFARYTDVAKRVVPLTTHDFSQINAAWLVFLNNAAACLSMLEAHSIPFVFVLYPGGGFHLNDPETDNKLTRILASPQLRGVVATQPIIIDTLQRFNCRVPIHYLPGVVVDPSLVEGSAPRPPHSRNEPLRICFAGFRYDKGGGSKGYPEFIAAAEILGRLHPDLRFAVAGDLGPADWPIVPFLKERISFAGAMPTDGLREFFLTQDVMIAPSRRYALSGKAFDGFPTGTSVEASLCGAAVVGSDELDQNRFYTSETNILIVEPTVEDIVAKLDPLIRDPDRLAALAEAGRKRTVELYGAEQQLLTRSRILQDLVDSL